VYHALATIRRRWVNELSWVPGVVLSTVILALGVVAARIRVRDRSDQRLRQQDMCEAEMLIRGRGIGS
jgi:hypothetical protein